MVLKSKGELEMKSWKKSPLVVAVLVLLVAGGVLGVSLSAASQDNNSNSGIPGLQGPGFTLGLVLGASLGNNPNVPGSASGVLNGAPYALTGYILSKNGGSVHIWLTEFSQVLADLGYKVGDTIEIFCSPSQIEDLNTGDYVEMYGFTVRGYLVRTDDTVLPAPFSY
jgi:hypothetical protein